MRTKGCQGHRSAAIGIFLFNAAGLWARVRRDNTHAAHGDEYSHKSGQSLNHLGTPSRLNCDPIDMQICPTTEWYVNYFQVCKAWFKIAVVTVSARGPGLRKMQLA
jgi:hypothetical protein